MDYNSFYSQFNNQGDQNSGSSSQPLNQTPAGDDSGQAGNQVPASSNQVPPSDDIQATAPVVPDQESSQPPVDASVPKTDDLPSVKLPTIPSPTPTTPPPTTDNQNNIPLVTPTMPVTDGSENSPTPPAPPSAAPEENPATEEKDASVANNSSDEIVDSKEDPLGVVQQLISEDIFKELGLENISDEEKEKKLNEFGEIVERAVTAKIIQTLGNEKGKELDKLLDEADGDKIEQYIAENVPNLADIVIEETLRFKKQFIDDANNIKKMIESQKGE